MASPLNGGSATHGGGVYISDASTVQNCVIRRCEAEYYGGGVFLHEGGASQTV